jgi:hypothetical protein
VYDNEELLQKRNVFTSPMLEGLCYYVQSFLVCVARALTIEAGASISQNVFPTEEEAVLCELVLHCLGGLVRAPDGTIPENDDQQLLQAYTITSERCVVVEVAFISLLPCFT